MDEKEGVIYPWRNDDRGDIHSVNPTIEDLAQCPNWQNRPVALYLPLLGRGFPIWLPQCVAMPYVEDILAAIEDLLLEQDDPRCDPSCNIYSAQAGEDEAFCALVKGKALTGPIKDAGSIGYTSYSYSGAYAICFVFGRDIAEAYKRLAEARIYAIDDHKLAAIMWKVARSKGAEGNV